MPSNFDSSKYKKIFESRYGAGSYDAGLSNARNIGATKAQVDISKDEYNKRLKEYQKAQKEAEKKASKKTYEDALAYWNDPENNSALRKQGANRNAENIRNDPMLQAQIKEQGFTVNDYINAMYNASSNGQFRSEREFKEYTKQLNKEVKAEKNNVYKKYNLQEPTSKKSEQKKGDLSVLKKNNNDKDKKNKNNGSLLNDIMTPLKNFGQAINPFDDVSFTEAFKNNVDDAVSTDRSKFTKESTRGLTRLANTATLGTLDQVYKKTNDGQRATQFTNEDRSLAGKITDFGYDALGYLVPGMGTYKAIRGAGLGLKPGSKGLDKLKQLAQEGAIAGGIIGGGEVGVREALNPQDTNYKDNLKHVFLGAGLGAIADPALYGLGKGISKAVQSSLAPFAKGDVPTFSGAPRESVTNSLPNGNLAPSKSAANNLPISNPANSRVSNELYNRLSGLARPKGEMLPVDNIPTANRPKQTTNNPEVYKNTVQDAELLENAELMRMLEDAVASTIEQPSFSRLSDLQTPEPTQQPSLARLSEIQSSQPTQQPSLDRLRPGRDFEPIESGVNVPEPPLNRVSETLLDTRAQALGNADSFRMKINDTPQKKDSIFNGLRTQFIDDVAPLEAIEKQIAGKVGSAENSLYKQSRLFKGSPEKAHMIVQEQLSPIFRDLQKSKINYKDLRDYALAVHAKDVNSKGINSGFTTAEIDDVISKLGSEQMEAMRQKLLGVNNHVLDMLSTGDKPILSGEQVTAMKEKWPNYMSLFRSFDDDKIEFASGINKAMTNATNPIKKLEGSSRDVIDPMESMVKNIFKAVNAVEKNKVAAQVGKLAEKDVEGNFIRKLADNEDASRLNVISLLDNGKKVKYEVPPDVYRTLMNLDKESTNTLIKILQKPASLLRAGATLTPEFSLRNPLRDVPHAFVVSNSGFNPITDFPVGLWQSIWKGRTIKIGNKEFKTSGDLYKQWVKENGGYGNIISMDRELHKKTLQKALKEVNSNYVDILDPKAYTTLMKKLANPIGVLRTIADTSESATKVGEFRAALRKGVTPQEAAYRARDIMDFGRAGVSIREANKVVAFLNANIQGKSKLWRAFKENKAQVIGKSIASVTIPTIGAIVAQHKLANDKQKEILNDAPQWLKDTFYLIPIPGTNQIARIPKPFDLAFAFSNTFERAADYAYKNDKKAFDDWIKQGFSTAAVPTMLTGVAPIVEGMANYSFFKQGPIIPQREQNMQFPDQYDINTTQTARFIGNQVNKVTNGHGAFKNFGSPRVIDNTIQGFTGGLGTYGTSAIDWLVNSISDADKPEKPTKSIDQSPLTKAFLVNQSSTGDSIDKLYKLKDTLNKQRGSAKQNEQEFKKEDLYKFVDEVTKDIAEINKEIRAVENSPDLSGDEKKRAVDDLNKVRNDIARQIMQRLNNVE